MIGVSYGAPTECKSNGKKVGVLDASIVERTHDNAPWHTYGLKPGPHTLELVTTDAKDARSKGSTVAVSQAVIYRK